MLNNLLDMIWVLNDVAVFYKFKNSNCGYLKVYSFAYWSILSGDKYYLVNREAVFEHLDERDKFKYIFNLDLINKLSVDSCQKPASGGVFYYRLYHDHDGIMRLDVKADYDAKYI